MLTKRCVCSFEAYGVASEDPTRPGKVITIKSVPISEYWFKMIFLGEQRLFDSLYEYDHDPPYQSKPVEFDKQEVLERWESACARLRDPCVQSPEGLQVAKLESAREQVIRK